MSFHSKRYSPCLNCGKQGHEQKACPEPVTSWGIIPVKIDRRNADLMHCDTNLKKYEEFAGISLSDKKSLDDLAVISEYMEKIKFLLVRRKHSLGFGEFISGKYVLENINGILSHFNLMVQEEIDMIKVMTFDELWEYYWGRHQPSEMITRRYVDSKEKFMKLKANSPMTVGLDFYINSAKPYYDFPEWGFPKGKKKRGENDLDCAVREFCEETGLERSDLNVLRNIAPVREDFNGTNGVRYRHIYYVAEVKSDARPVIVTNGHDHCEIGDIGFFTYQRAIEMFRDYHVDRKKILESIMNYYIKLIKLGRGERKPDEEWRAEKDFL